MKTIIAPTDFSDISLNAVDYAADLAMDINAELILINVQIAVPVAENNSTQLEYEELTGGAKDKLEALATELTERTKNKINVSPKFMVGSVEHELEIICEQNKPFAVVMATNVSGVAQSFFLGSYTLFAVKHSACPVLVVPHNASFNGINKMALAYDPKEMESFNTLAFLKLWLNTFKCRLDIISVIEPNGIKGNTSTFASLEKVLSEFHPHFYFVEKGDVEEGVYQYAEENKPDILVVVPKQHGALSGLLHKSRSKPFILHSSIPVLTVREK